MRANSIRLAVVLLAASAGDQAWGQWVNCLDTTANTCTLNGVGIGRPNLNPAYPLDINQAADGVIARFLANNGNGLYVGVSNTAPNEVSFYSTGANAGTFAFYTGGSPVLNISASGNVGVGTTAPSFPLQISTRGYGNAPLFSASDSPGLLKMIASGQADLTNGPTSVKIQGSLVTWPVQTPSTYFQIGGAFNDGNKVSNEFGAGSVALVIERFLGGNNHTTALTFSTNPASFSNASAFERMRITSAGNVGIGTTTPAATLDVSGSINASGSLTAGSVSSSGGVFSNSVSIGDTSAQCGSATQTCRLSVKGAVGAGEVVVAATGGWSDYVFEEGYRIAPLSEVAGYIAENHRLPEIPSAAEVAEKGVNLGEMQAKLLAKIEELTLHMIQAEERSDRIEQQNKDLREQNRMIREQIADLERKVSR